jgi:hypothetical protein
MVSAGGLAHISTSFLRFCRASYRTLLRELNLAAGVAVVLVAPIGVVVTIVYLPAATIPDLSIATILSGWSWTCRVPNRVPNWCQLAAQHPERRALLRLSVAIQLFQREVRAANSSPR